MTDTTVTILVPNYKTLALTKLCLRLLRKNIDRNKAHVVVIDNDSRDDSLAYLKSLNWIELIERPREPDDTPALSHSRALDLALKNVTTPYVLSIHTDTLFKRSDTIDMLVSEIQRDPKRAGVGSWKLENPPSFLKRIGKSLEYAYRGLRYRLQFDADRVEALEGQKTSGYYSIFRRADPTFLAKDYYYLRSHCSLYRMDLIRKYGLQFGPDTAGKAMHQGFIRQGYEMVFLSSDFLRSYIVHINHATMVLQPELGSGRKTIVKGRRRIKRELSKINADRILADDTLDS